MSNPAETYESYMVPVMFAPLVDHLLAFTDPRPGERVLDLACGTGIVARRFAPRVAPGGWVTGLDLSPGMLQVAQAKALQEGVDIDWREGDAEALPFPEGSFDLALCQMALQFMPDRAQVIAEVYRVLADGGRFALNAWYGFDRNPFQAALSAACVRHAGIDLIEGPFCLGDPAEVCELLSATGFVDVEVEPVSIVARHPDPERYPEAQIRGATAAIPALRDLDEGRQAACIQAVREEIAGLLREHTVGEHLEVPMHGYAIRAHRPAVSPAAGSARAA